MTNSTTDREIITSRVIDAPQDLVFAAFTEKKHVESWWLPSGSTTEEFDGKPGGAWKYNMTTPDGDSYPIKITFVEIEKPSRLVYDYGSEGDPNPVRTNVTFEAEGNKTKVTLHLVFATAEALDEAKSYGAIGGASQSLKDLEAYVKSL